MHIVCSNSQKTSVGGGGKKERGDGGKKESSLLTANATAGAADFGRRTATTTRGWMSY